MIRALLLSLGLTLAVEVPLAWLGGLRTRHWVGLAVLANCLTNPAVVWLHWALGPASVLPLELAAVLVEGGLYRACGAPARHPFFFSLALNGLSYGLGILIQYGGIL